MAAIVVYESLWGNTAAVARAIAEGIGSGARALSTAGATSDVIAGADLIVAGAPVLGFTLPTEAMRTSIRTGPQYASNPGDFSHPSMRSWLATLSPGSGCGAAFETRVSGPVPGGSTKAIIRGLSAAGRRVVGDGERFIVTGRYGPLRDGELERARAWGVELAKSADS
jgi:hypothetical protein